MFASLTLPYVSQDPPPGPIPTVEQIESSKIIYSDQYARRLVGVGEHFIVRYGSRGIRREGLNLLFARETVGIPVPRVYSMFEDEQGRTFLVMERIKGSNLQDTWPSLTESEKSNYLAKLKVILERMRAIVPPEPHFFGGIDGGDVPHPLFWDPSNDQTISGPFRNEDQFNMGLVAKLRQIWAENYKHSYRADWFQVRLDMVLKDHRSVFSHADIQQRNIMVHRSACDSKSRGEDIDLVIVDWETAGWYPSYWEHSMAFIAFRWDSDWLLRLEDVLRPWTAETMIMNTLYRDIVF